MTTSHETDELTRILGRAADQSSDAVAIFAADDWPIGSEVIYANAAYLALSGYRADELIGHSSILLAGAQPDVGHVAAVLRAPKDRPFSATLRKHRPDGSTYDVEMRISPLRNDHGATTHYVLTERRAASAADDESHTDRLLIERFASIRGLAAGTAYALDAPLSNVVAQVRSALETIDAGTADEGTLRRALVAAADAATVARETVRGLRAFNHDESLEPIDVHEAIERAAAVCNEEVGARAILLRRYAPIDPVRGNLGSLANVLVQVLRNAAESIPPDMPFANGISIRTEQTPSNNVTIDIADTGVGIEPGDIPYVFDPYFTTKARIGAPGLGLAAARATVLAMGGAMTIDSVLGRGTRVRITLPAVTTRTRQASETPPYFASDTLPPRRILSVGTTHEQARRIGGMLDHGDAQVTYATTSEAIERLALGGTFDMVVCEARPASPDEFRSRLRGIAPEILNRTFALLPPPSQSGVFTRFDVGGGATGTDE